MSAKQIRWGILGTGQIAAVIAKAIQESTTSQLIAVAGRSAEKARAFALTFSIPNNYADYDALIADPDIDVVYIALPNHLHKEWIMRSALAGKHILCAPPFVTTLQDAQDVFAVVRKAGVFCMEGLMYRCHPFTTKLCELMRSKAIGEVRFFNAVYMTDTPTTSKSSILNLGTYPLSLIRLLAGTAHAKQTAEPSDVISIGELDSTSEYDKRASVLIHFPNQMMASISVAADSGMHAKLDIYGTQGQINVVTNPWLPDRENNKITIQYYDQTEKIDIHVTAEQALSTYQIDVVSNTILQNKIMDNHEGISWLETLGNIVVLEAWLNQVKAKAVTT